MEITEENDRTLHTLNKVKLKPLLSYLWTDLETILVDMPCDFKLDIQKKYKNGFLLVTYGGIYLFKNKLLVSPPPKFILTLLDCQTVTCKAKSSTIVMEYENYVVKIKVKEALKIINIMAKIVAECTYGLKKYIILPRFQIKKEINESIDEILVKDKSKNVKKYKTKLQNENNNNTKESDDSVNNSPSSSKQKEINSKKSSVDSPSFKKQNDVNSKKSSGDSPSFKKQNDVNSKKSSGDSPSFKKQNDVNSKNSSHLNEDNSTSDSHEENYSNIKIQRIATLENLPNPTEKSNLFSIPYSRSESSFFYCFNDDNKDDVYERIHLSQMVKSRPKYALFKRSLFLAHFYNIYGTRLGDGCKYIKKYDEDPVDTLTIGPHFVASQFLLSYGHSIGWETNLTKVMFYHYKPMFFGPLLESILINSITINQICFLGYKCSTKTLDEFMSESSKQQRKKIQKMKKKSKEEDNFIDMDDDDDIEIRNKDKDINKSNFDERQSKEITDYFDHFKIKNSHSKTKFPIYIPDFSFKKVTSTNVTSFWFHECDYLVIISFFEELQNYVCPIYEFEMTLCHFHSTQIGRILKDISSIKCFNQLNSFIFFKNTVKTIPIDCFQQFINIANHLEKIDISECNTKLDGSQLFTIICKSHSPIKSIKLSKLKFNKLNDISSMKIPSTLIHADFSKNSFSPQSFENILLLFTKQRTNELKDKSELESSIMLCMSSISMDIEGYEVFNKLDFSKLSDNICEFDWSNNILPPNCVDSFFKFLETQKKMRILILNNIQPENQNFFFKRLLKYVMKQKLPGLDMRAKLCNEQGISFYESLKKATFIRKLGVVIRDGGDEVIEKFNELIQMLPMLTELKADGFSPHKEKSIITLWKTINDHPTICANDLPRVDFLYLENSHGIKINDEESINMLKNMKENRKKPSSMQQRTDFTIAQIHARNKNAENNHSNRNDESDFFVASCSTPWIDSTPQSRLENLESDHNIINKQDINDDVDDSALLLNLSNDDLNKCETYDMTCFQDDPKSSEIAPSKMPEYDNDKNNETDKVDDDDDEFNNQSIDETESDNENKDKNYE